MKILHIINTLEHGGAQSVLLQLAKGLNAEKNSQAVIILKQQNQLSVKFEALNIPVKFIHPINLFKLIKTIRAYQPDLIQTWLYHSDLIGCLVKFFNWRVPLIWGVHHTTDNLKTLKPTTAWIVRILALLSNWIPNQIICCSESAYQTHLALGYSKEKMVVIPNGVDTSYFQPNSSASDLIKKELGLEEKVCLIGMFARYHPQKDFQTLIHAAKNLLQKNSRIHFVLAGAGVDSSNQELMGWVKSENLQNHFHLLGNRNDMPTLIAAMKVITLTSSHGEAMPQILTEAMACGVPCVATNIGDVKKIISETGFVVEAKQPASLAEAWQKLIELKDEEYNLLAVKTRERAVRFYDSQLMTNQYNKIYRALIQNEDNKFN